jgi:hypothetical protein
MIDARTASQCLFAAAYSLAKLLRALDQPFL